MELEYTRDCIEHRTRVIFPDMPWMLRKGRLLEDGNKLEMPLTMCLVAKPFLRLYFNWFILIQSQNLFCKSKYPQLPGHLDTRKPINLNQMYESLSSEAEPQYTDYFKYNIY